MKSFVSNISNREFDIHEMVLGEDLRKSILEFIKKEHPDFNENSKMSLSELNFFREQYISEFLSKEVSELNELEKTVDKALGDKPSLLYGLEEKTQDYTFGQRVADKVAEFGGSWTFIISFVVFLILWIITNVFFLLNKGFDPFPFILLNLILSCIAALQAPVIMMSQNRQEEKDRERAKNDYMINIKSELEIRMLHEKIDHLIMHQEEALIELQKVQIDMMNDILKHVKK
ncbi:DUF1003 domain-containing protein [Flavobacterium luminosum]|uniref:DUF1003 domain-containing protein n=1 Tax=Flavobacterium luminosum TaxID=2949086 RepID=A0ABT0TS32_9FLAO|nr:DUF1003 domain-containing protein [Flavobacterium sp. HXWNR70]MCL9809698.1 DUF1003 domain-containing protein [Flavobacterium sp. HXWNR70]